MEIKVQATLTEEQAIILAKEKGWCETESIVVDNTVFPPVAQEVPNTKTAYMFLQEVYQNMITGDASRIYIAYDDKLNVDKKIARENYIREWVASSISSSVE